VHICIREIGNIDILLQKTIYLLYSSDRGFSSETGEGGGPRRKLADPGLPGKTAIKWK